MSTVVQLNALLHRSVAPNAFSLRLPVPSALNIPQWRHRLITYHDKDLCDFLEFGWPIGYTKLTLPQSSHQNHGSALAQPGVIDAFLEKECNLGATCGPFSANPLQPPLTTSPLQIARSRSGKPRVVVDLSHPQGTSVNSGIPKDTYLNEPISLRLPGTDALQIIIRDKGPGCHLFKKDLSRAYRQLRVDPRDYSYLGFRHNGLLYFDIAPPFGLRSATMMCQRTTCAVTFMFRSLGFDCTNYIDDYGGAEIPAKSREAFDALGHLLLDLGLQSSPDKDSPPSTSMVFLGVAFNTVDMTMSVTPARLSDLLSQCHAALFQSRISLADLRSLLGVMSFVTACVCPARIFMNGLLNALRTHPHSRFCPLSDNLKSDLRWWCSFLPQYNGVSIIKTEPWITNPIFLSTDACQTGAGAFCNGYFFHTPFPDSLLATFGHDINTLELLTIMAALKLWGHLLQGQRFILKCDNVNSVQALNSGRSRSFGMQACLREIWLLSALHDFELQAEHLPGRDNTIADHLSRWHLAPSHQAQFPSLTADLITTPVVCPPELFQFDLQL